MNRSEHVVRVRSGRFVCMACHTYSGRTMATKKGWLLTSCNAEPQAHKIIPHSSHNVQADGRKLVCIVCRVGVKYSGLRRQCRRGRGARRTLQPADSEPFELDEELLAGGSMWDLASSLGTPVHRGDPSGSPGRPAGDLPRESQVASQATGGTEDTPARHEARALLQQSIRSAFDDPEGMSMEEPDEL